MAGREKLRPWDRGDLPFRLMFARRPLFLPRVFLPDTERKRVKIGARWGIFGRESLATGRGGFENKGEEDTDWMTDRSERSSSVLVAIFWGSGRVRRVN